MPIVDAKLQQISEITTFLQALQKFARLVFFMYLCDIINFTFMTQHNKCMEEAEKLLNNK
jgi:hypothetical protein